MEKYNKKLENNFYNMKKLLEDKFMFKKEIDGFYYTIGAIEKAKKAMKQYGLNSYYDLTISNFLNMIEENNSILEVKQSLFYEYQAEYANFWYNNFLEILGGVE